MENKLMTTTEARKRLGVSTKKMSDLIAEGQIAVEHNPLDKRVKLIKVSEVEKLRAVNKLMVTVIE
jgi:hypothetical protein